MVRRCLLLLAASGCDLVLGAEIPEPPAPKTCGPFGPPAPLVFAASLVGARDFSVDATGRRGMVTATRTSAQGRTWTGPHAVMPDDAGMWIPDDAHDRPVLDSLDGAHIVETGNAFGWIDATAFGPSVLHEYEFSPATGMWGQLVSLIDNDLTYDNHVGNAIYLPLDATAVLKFLVEIKLPRAGTAGPSKLVILQQLPGQPWQVTSQASPLGSIDERIEPSGGVMTSDHEVLLYAARVRGGSSRLYASRRINNEFAPGSPVVIADVPADAALTEPWIDSTCRTLYFRWDDTTWMTTALDGSSSGS